MQQQKMIPCNGEAATEKKVMRRQSGRKKQQEKQQYIEAASVKLVATANIHAPAENEVVPNSAFKHEGKKKRAVQSWTDYQRVILLRVMKDLNVGKDPLASQWILVAARMQAYGFDLDDDKCRQQVHAYYFCFCFIRSDKPVQNGHKVDKIITGMYMYIAPCISARLYVSEV